jgi:GNAT superfamily N-acetyltransferase
MVINVETVRGKREIKEFLAVAPPLYRDTPAWVHPLDRQLLSCLDRGKDPFWKHSEGELFVARKSGAAIARLLVMHDRLMKDTLGEDIATFGLFEAPRDIEATQALFDEAGKWARQHGLTALLGPLFPSIHREVGLLVDGFDRPPRVMMPYGHDYYSGLLKQVGFTTVRELYAYEWDIQQQVIPEPRHLPRNIVVRPFARHRYADDVQRFLHVYNDAFSDNWGFVPITRMEAEAAVKDFVHYADLALPKFAEVGGEPAGFILALPDMNEVISRCRGKLWPFGLFRIIWGRHLIQNLRVVTLAVRPQFRPLGIAHHLISQLWKSARSRGYRNAEFGYIDDQNRVMRKIVERIGARKVKTYRLYRKSL